MRELSIVSFSGIRYGIWKDEIRSVRDIDALHRIPLSPVCIAGILIEEGQAVTLVDLPACLGYGTSTEAGQGIILLMDEGEKDMGFVISGEIDTQPIPPELLFPLPDFLATPMFEFCAVHDGISIPIINAAEIYSRVVQADEASSVNSLCVSAARPLDISGAPQIRIFFVGGELFAASAVGLDSKPAKPGVVTPLPNTPVYVKGITFQDGRLLPVIDLSQRIKRQNAAQESLMLTAEIGGYAFGFLIDGDVEALQANKISVVPAPMIVQNSWMKHMVVSVEELIPFVDLTLALFPGDADEKPLWQRYTPGSRFSDDFFKHDIEIVEFSLLGERHALPKLEVEDDIVFKNYRALFDAPPIVIGVAEHNGEILPVVDLAMMFGRRSLATPAWRMMLVSNGDFRALVITETVFKARWLPLDIHRAVPIHLPHNLMYGCYPDAEAVRLILNVEAISVHFEKSLIQKFLPVLSEEMRVMSVEAEPAYGVEPAIVPPPSPLEPEVAVVLDPASEHQEAGEPVHERPQQVVETNTGSIEVQEQTASDPDAVSEIPSLAEDVQEDMIEAEAVLSGQSFAETFKAPAPKGAALKFQATKSGHAATMREFVKNPPESLLARSDVDLATAASRSSEPICIEAGISPSISPRLYREGRTAGVWKRRIAYGAIASVLVAGVYIAGTYYRPDTERSVKVSEVARVGQDKAMTVQRMEQTKSTQAQVESARIKPGPVVVQAEPSRQAEKLRAPLELDIPKNMPPIDIDVYVVVKGDTLWSISERFTGSSFNYPRIAGENRIADPDLIFPGQRIKLNK